MLLDDLTQDLNQSLKSGDKLRTETLRYLIAAIKKFAIDNYPPASGKELTDEDVTKVIRKQVKTHEESITAFTRGVRPDLVSKETVELAILKTYLPPEMTDEEIRLIVKSVTGSGQMQFGQVMGAVMARISGKAGGDRVGKIVKEELQK
ncbi:MAG: hypothetical protein UV61_C0008G0044 [Candidatus Gottesmanbacteria bacterium GW2011_GWB1_43_11]|uniref:Glutamyl-tRNA amidotransferase n=1 Tax=Candidatus Gottesmanbacteria bacterium GW2011_GWB1_43_11 TaxID=1618446 RepID=A0A0G1EU78_9BACT|nr:MAG: hypothetical protein UV04_C0003G0045 [Candidatus Gottesmanbacteria bacterium GW2011_GWA2_42_16]KKS51501.1 MAG: hypothetical protein UV17_C0061G0005 [Candidatus Gottesmanbacteria bacterium GW2011_GWA1_42_26]KKS80761.1 MAG: hypothetical protein UV55_C0031G0038 [Candidatus Gottesmanbacteria bacterium GW2011_GWC1_43_10]KKS86591.1 MAG: hypothetical protein UV61_C0008G0044 [Candidatus Gottesmanbacteria bacterium GW2011_GWB1_43_11]OGG09182.1 MAG: hypothetical protein A2699_02320 [Candidatus Go